VTLTTYTGLYQLGPVFGDVQVSTVTMDMSYFMLVSRNFGKPGTFASGDANGDGTVNLADLLLLTRNYGHALPSPSSNTASAQALASSSDSPTLRRRRV